MNRRESEENFYKNEEREMKGDAVSS